MIEAHIFYYRWPRLKLEPQHEVQKVWNFAEVNTNDRAFIFFNYQWYQQIQISIRPVRYSTRFIDPSIVPPEFRALALISVP